MRIRNYIGIIIFTLGVFMLLLRPYAVYNMTVKEHLARNPARAWSLLQRLIKKKDEHHGREDSSVAIVATNSAQPLRSAQRLLLIFSAFFIAVYQRKSFAALHLPAITFLHQRYRYRMVSCLLI